jgi:outer membrane receptor protein involved in Fe transport
VTFPRHAGWFDVDLSYREFTFGYRMRYIGPMVTNLYEDFFPLDTACTSPTSCPPNNIDWADRMFYPEVFYHDVRLEWDVNQDGEGPALNFYMGVDNVLNTHPPLGLTGTGAGSGIYPFRGRSFYAGARAAF